MLRILQQYYPIRNFVFLLGEGLAIYCSVIIATWMVAGPIVSLPFILSRKAALIAAICLPCLYYNDLYDLKITHSLSELMIRLLQSLGISSIILAGIFFVYPGTIINSRAYIISIIIAMSLIFIWRIAYYLILDYGIFNQKIALMGSGDLAENIYNEISDKWDCGYEIELLISEINPNQELNENNTVPSIRLDDSSNLLERTTDLNIKKISHFSHYIVWIEIDSVCVSNRPYNICIMT